MGKDARRGNRSCALLQAISSLISATLHFSAAVATNFAAKMAMTDKPAVFRMAPQRYIENRPSHEAPSCSRLGCAFFTLY